MSRETNVKREPMQRITLTVSFDQALLEVEGKSASNGRLFNGDFRGTEAAKLLSVVCKRLISNVQTKNPVVLKVNEKFEILPVQ